MAHEPFDGDRSDRGALYPWRMIVLLLSAVITTGLMIFFFFTNPLNFVSIDCSQTVASVNEILSSGCLEYGEFLTYWIALCVPVTAISFAVSFAVSEVGRLFFSAGRRE